MSKHHRVSVDNGKYTFISGQGYGDIEVLRYNQQFLVIKAGSGAIYSLMCDLDAARLVLQATETDVPGETIDDKLNRIKIALENHHGLVGAPMPPSEWTK